jgi:dTDP-4-dehydrorhamnose reductase
MKKIAIFAPTGMLGSMVYKVLKDKYELILVYRDEDKLKILNDAYGDVNKHRKVQLDIVSIFNDHVVQPVFADAIAEIGEVDAVINCAGVIKPYSTKNPSETFYINGVFPHLLANTYGSRLIHITTDCAFNGIENAPYDEKSIKNATDLYGISKILGEVSDRSLVLRTSIIGPEITGFVSLIEWFKKQSGETISGFSTHLWNGITTKEFGNVCDRIISNRPDFPATGLYHIFGSDVTKYEMVQAFKDKYGIDVTINEATPPAVDRRLRSIHTLNDQLHIPTFQEMITDL